MDRFNEYLKGQVTEIVKNYHPAVIWFDGQWEKPWTDDRAGPCTPTSEVWIPS